MNRPDNSASPPRRERGSALIVALLFVVIIAMLGMSSMSTSTLAEKMSGNSRDQNIALQAAEVALRDAERDLTNTVVGTGRVITTAGFVAGCTLGLCTEGAALSNLDGATTSAFYGQFDVNVTRLEGVQQQPRYLIELLTTVPAQTPVPPVGQTVRNFRISSKGWGKNVNTVVILQTVHQVTL